MPGDCAPGRSPMLPDAQLATTFFASVVALQNTDTMVKPDFRALRLVGIDGRI